MKARTLVDMWAIADPPAVEGAPAMLSGAVLCPVDSRPTVERAYFCSGENEWYWTLFFGNGAVAVMPEHVLRREAEIDLEPREPEPVFRQTSMRRVAQERVARHQARSEAAKRAWVTIRARRAKAAARWQVICLLSVNMVK